MNAFRSASSFIIIAALLHVAFSHSYVLEPSPMSERECRIGGPPGFPRNCSGPCDLTQFTGNNADDPNVEFYPPNKPGNTIYERGQEVTVKYLRNNHPVGGFNRFSLVRYDPDQTGPESGKDYMNKEIHSRNAFSYSCWGARTVTRPRSIFQGMSNYERYMLFGTDGRFNSLDPGWYTVDIIIPPVVPDGLYVLGWVSYIFPNIFR